MNIEITPQEYRTLLDILHLADVVISGHQTEEETRNEQHRQLIQKLYAHANDAGLDKLVRYNQSSGRYSPAPDFEQATPAHMLIRDFGEHLFWDQLISRLTIRDAAQTAGGIEHLNALSDNDRQRLESPIRQRYIHEFSIRGVANLEIVEFGSESENMPVETSD